MPAKKTDVGADQIIVKGAKTHNLKNITVKMPRNKMIVFTGISGSGKSSLAFDTIFAEGQRRYVESLSAYARQFLRQMQKPDVEEIVGLSPAISIDQKSRSNNPRSTVATITEIYDYLRILYARVGTVYCPKHDVEIKRLSQDEITKIILKTIEGDLRKGNKKSVTGVAKTSQEADRKIIILSPVVVGRKGEYYQLLYDLLGKGYQKVRIDGVTKSLRNNITLSKTKRHDIDVQVDEIFVNEFRENYENAHERLSEAIEQALNESDGLIKIINPVGEEKMLSAKFICPLDGSSFPEVEPRLFSFNSPYGACSSCNGLGTKYFFGNEVCPECKGARLRPHALRVFLRSKNEKDSKGGLKPAKKQVRPNISKGNVLGKNIVDFTDLSIKEARDFIVNLDLTPQQHDISGTVINEIRNRLQFMLDVGIEYLTLNRRANTLSGGEAQRIRLASQLGSGLVGALYVLDEPTIGLHPRDNDRLIKTLLELRDLGNTIIVVEHDEDTIFSSDYMVDLGKGAGIHGGRVVVADDIEKLLTAKENISGSLTLDYLRGTKKIPIPKKRRTGNKGMLKIRGGKIFNIKNLSLDVPLGRLSIITGVSGSGKSTLLYEILFKNLRAQFDRKYRTNDVFNAASFTGTEYLSRVILIDQSPIGRTPRSNPATYTGAFTFIRELFSETSEAKARGWKPGRFSFNVKGGRCEACQGNGAISVEMHFLPTVYVTCDVCRGKRFTKETLQVKLRMKKPRRKVGVPIETSGKNIYEVLRMTVEEALVFFEDIPAIYDRLKTLNEVGLGYLGLGQSATTLSGGEAQRVKISSELYRPLLQKTIYLLDEPTIGLHYEDVKKLIEILERLVERGNTVVVIEHNMDIIKSADYVMDIGPEGGDKGGILVAKGTPEEIAETKGSFTGQYLRRVLRR